MDPKHVTKLGFTPGATALLVAGLPLAGGGLGLALPHLAELLADLPWAPFQGPARLVASWNSGWVVIAAPLVGALLGLVVTVLAYVEALLVTVSDAEVTLRKDDDERRFTRDEVTAVFLDGKELVLLGAGSRELARDAHESTADRMAAAFRAHGWPWLAEDPHRAEFRRWVPDDPDLPAAVNALLAARGRALEKKDHDDARQLRTELGRLGHIVRDEGTRQFVRPVAPS